MEGPILGLPQPKIFLWQMLCDAGVDFSQVSNSCRRVLLGLLEIQTLWVCGQENHLPTFTFHAYLFGRDVEHQPHCAPPLLRVVCCCACCYLLVAACYPDGNADPDPTQVMKAVQSKLLGDHPATLTALLD